MATAWNARRDSDGRDVKDVIFIFTKRMPAGGCRLESYINRYDAALPTPCFVVDDDEAIARSICGNNQFAIR
jgi:hypothetical protein